MFLKDIFSIFLVPFLFGFSIGVILASQKVLRGVPSSFLRETDDNCHYFFYKCLVELAGEIIWTYRFLSQRVLSYEFNFLNIIRQFWLSTLYWVILIVCSFFFCEGL